MAQSSNGGNAGGTPPHVAFLSGDTPRILTGWLVAYMVLLIAAESSPSVAPLAVAFAWLIAISVVYAGGPQLWTTISGLIEKGSLTGG